MRRLTPHELADADPNDLLPVRDVARLLQVHPDTVRKWVHDDKLATVTIGGRHHVLLTHASEVEHQARQGTRGRPRRTNDNKGIHQIVCP